MARMAPDRMSALGTFWRGFTDQVMGGVSTAASPMETIEGRRAPRLVGEVSPENNGGFVQMALPLTGSGHPLDASAYRGIRVTGRAGACDSGRCRLPWPLIPLALRVPPPFPRNGKACDARLRALSGQSLEA